MEKYPMRHYRQLSDASADSADSESSDESMGNPPSFRVLENHGHTVMREFEQGVSGKVFLTNKEEVSYAVKEINFRDKKSLHTVRKEVQILKSLNHGYIVSYVDSFEDKDDGRIYIVMEYCEGGDLSKLMQKQKPFEEKQILDWLVQICLALQYLYEKNIIHRDIKPQNVFLTEDGYINLGDFGSSKALKGADDYAKSAVGATLYISPEVYQRNYNYKSDIWSLGWLLHDLCMLDVWANNMQRHVLHANSMTGTPPPISERYSEELRELIRQMLSCDPKDRPSADEILAKPFLKEAVNRNRRIPDALKQQLLTSIDNFNEAYDNHYNDFETVVSEWKTATDSLEEIHHKCTVGSLSGAVIGAAGGITALVGVGLAPFTFGVSLIVSGVGIGVGVAGGVTGAASNITNNVKQKSLRESFEKLQQDYKKASEPILNSLEKLRKLQRKLTKFCDFVPSSTLDNVQMSWRICRVGVAGVTEFVFLGLVAGSRIAVQSAGVGEAVAAASGVLSGILVIADIAFIVKDAREIHRMRRGRDDPEKVQSPVLKAIAQMRKTHSELCKVLRVIQETKDELASGGRN